MNTAHAAFASATLAFAGAASAGTADLLYVDQAYTSLAQSLILGQPGADVFHVETFEDGLLNSPFLNASDGFVRGSGASTDSVDVDDGTGDGYGLDGRSWKVEASSVTFSFTPRAGAEPLPLWVGVVVTDLRQGLQDITIEAFDADGFTLGGQTIQMEGDARQGLSAEDRFIGMRWGGGISAFTISVGAGTLELDHAQYAYSSIMPVPGAMAMGLAGLLGLGFMGRRRRDYSAIADV